METCRARRGTTVSRHALGKQQRLDGGESPPFRRRHDGGFAGWGGCRRCTCPGEGEAEGGAGQGGQRRRRRGGGRPRMSSLTVTSIVSAGALAAAGLPLVQGTSAGFFHTCAILNPTAEVKCWGDNSMGQLGLNVEESLGIEVSDMGDSLDPVPLGTGFSAVTIASGDNHNCAISSDGGLKCWGLNGHGQLGLGDTLNRGQNTSADDMGDNLDFVDLGSEETATYVSLGLRHSCAVLSSGSLKCWGANESGQLGLGDNVTRGAEPGQMGDDLSTVDIGNYTVTAVALGNRHTCTLLDGGLVKCWGNSDGGQLGYENYQSRGDDPSDMGDNLPTVDLGRDLRAMAISAGPFHSCALLNTGMVKCWGFNPYGQLGQLGPGGNGNIGSTEGSMGDSLDPIELGTNRTVTAISCGGLHSCAVLDDSTVKCWGSGLFGATGHGDSVDRGRNASDMGDNLLSVNLTFGRGDGLVDNVFGGAYHTCVAGTNGGVACFGYNNHGQLGVGNDENQGDEPGETDKLESIFLGSSFTVAAPDPGTFELETVSPTPAPTPAPTAVDTPFPTTLSSLSPQTPEPSLSEDAGTLAPSASSSSLDTRKPVNGESSSSNLSVEPDVTSAGSDDSNGSSKTGIAAIASAVVIAPLLCLGAFCCYWRRRKRRREPKDPQNGLAVAGTTANTDGQGDTSRQFTREGSGDSYERSMEGHTEGTLAQKPLVKGLSGRSSTSMREAASSAAGDVEAQVQEKENGTQVLSVGASASAAPSSTLLSGDEGDQDSSGHWDRLGGGSPRSSSHASDQENPGELRRRGMSRSSSGSSLSTLGSTSTTSTAWTNDPFNTPARTDIPRGSGGVRYGNGRGRGHVVVGSGGSEDSDTRRARATAVIGTATPASLAAATPGRLVPDTPSPRSTISTVGTPHPPEMRLAQFVRAGTLESCLYGVPELDNGRTAGSVLDSNKDNGMEGTWRGAGGRFHYRDVSASGVSTVSSTTSTNPGDSSMASGSAAASGAGGAALVSSGGVAVGATGAGVGGTPGRPSGSVTAAVASNTCASSASSLSPYGGGGTGGSASSPAEVVLTTPDRRRNGSGGSTVQGGGVVLGIGGAVFGAGNATDIPARRRSGRSSRSRASGDGSSPAGTESGVGEGGGVGGWNAPSFAEEAELEALQIDKNDLKLVFGRPFARGKTSEVYQVTHDGKNRAAKIIDLFLQGVVGDEVNRLYSSFAQELRVMKGIRHNCVSAVYGAVVTPSELTIVTDLVKRGPLRTVLDDKSKKESLTPDVRHKILKDIARGMSYLTEQGVQHRNLHSHNVLITNSWGAKVADYGLWRTMEVLMCADGSGKAGGANGSNKRKASWRSATLRWTAPELIVPPTDGSDRYTTASDVYSMGVIAWELLCGGSNLPYDGFSNEKVKSMILEGSTPSIPMETPIVYAKLILHCWRKNPTRRPTFAHIAEVLLNDPPPKPS